tara:strand:+ start:34 stop:252 length:219 start_codon:yes stop_codon:yes gene_type:complete
MGKIFDTIWAWWPDFNTTPGFILYTMLVYGFLMFTGWMANPALEESYQKEMRLEAARKKGKKMRAMNKRKDE